VGSADIDNDGRVDLVPLTTTLDTGPQVYVVPNRFRSPCFTANCDGSTVPPILNVNDFVCFMNAFAAGNPIANCDESTVAPVLNVNDFQCFVNRFAEASALPPPGCK
jgi:hypothetical protein